MVYHNHWKNSVSMAPHMDPTSKSTLGSSVYVYICLHKDFIKEQRGESGREREEKKTEEIWKRAGWESTNIQPWQKKKSSVKTNWRWNRGVTISSAFEVSSSATVPARHFASNMFGFHTESLEICKPIHLLIHIHIQRALNLMM